MKRRARINPQGRIVIPAECRAAAGLKAGDELLIETVGEGELRLRTPEQALKEAQRLGLQLGRPVITADQTWASLNVGVEVVLIP
jgi:AbrB family looped-hinge helix DNA binding protein